MKKSRRPGRHRVTECVLMWVCVCVYIRERETERDRNKEDSEFFLCPRWRPKLLSVAMEWNLRLCSFGSGLLIKAAEIEAISHRSFSLFIFSPTFLPCQILNRRPIRELCFFEWKKIYPLRSCTIQGSLSLTIKILHLNWPYWILEQTTPSMAGNI